MASLLRRITKAVTVLTLLALAACSNTSPIATQQSEPASDEVSAGADDMGDTSTADAVEEAANSIPEALPMADDDTASSGSLPRTTTDGIQLTADLVDFDFGNGPVASIEFTAEHSDGTAGLYLPFDKVVADTDVVDVLGWAGSNSTFVVVLETGPSVKLIRVLNAAGVIDQTAPNENQLAVIGARLNEFTDLQIDAVDEDGNVVASCGVNNLLLDCA